MGVDLDALLEKWRSLVPGWEIRIRWAQEGDCDDALATCSVSIPRSVAWIKVLPEGMEHEDDRPRDVESDVIHELLHVRFAPFKPRNGSLAYEFWESALERTAQDMRRLDRAAQHQ